jgi:hypothetical protein
MAQGEATASIELREGRLYLSRDLCDAYFAGCPYAALLARDGEWWLLPLASGAGGLQLKIRNARGDRVIEAREFFRAQDVPETGEPMLLIAAFDAARGGFRLRLPGAS